MVAKYTIGFSDLAERLRQINVWKHRIQQMAILLTLWGMTYVSATTAWPLL